MRRPRFARRRRRRPRLVALTSFRDEMRFLPGLYANLAGQVDGVIALDDGSVDGSGDFAARQALTLRVLTVAPGAQLELEDGRNQRALIEAAWPYGSDWLLGIDADERVEVEFRARAEREFARADQEQVSAFWIPWRELWDSPMHWRSDGIWGTKRKACLFRSDPAHRFDTRRVHSIWAGEGDWTQWPEADLRLYHLRMIRGEDRQRRVERYRRIDPDHVWQTIGYEYLLDETGIEVRPVEPGRHYRPITA
jgi:hypothetical protein